MGGIATASVVKAGGQKRITGISAAGEAEVSFDALPSYKLLYRRMPSEPRKNLQPVWRWREAFDGFRPSRRI
jgi:hypothetical protein